MERSVKTFSKKCIAAVLLVVFFCSMAVPAFAAEDPAPAETLTVSTAAKKKTILIGDSRTANLRQVRMGGKLIYDLIEQNGSILWDFKWGAKFTDLASNLIPRLELSGLDTIDNKTKIVVWMGYNDAVGIPTATAEEYAAYFNVMTALWVARGASVYILNVGPSGCMPGQSKADVENYRSNNKKIKAFNKTIKNGLISQAKYIDCYSYLVDSGYRTTDGTHYSAATSKKVYSFIMQKIK